VHQRLASRFKSLMQSVSRLECRLASAWVSAAHRRLMRIQWSFSPEPEHFDHQIDLYYHWLDTRDPTWLERGVFGTLALKGGQVLELACGDGFNARNCYSNRSTHVLACDFDATAIATARRKNRASNVEFLLADIRTAMPAGSFENIVWDGAIEHFTTDEIPGIMASIKRRLTPDGILSGYTIAAAPGGRKQLSHHEYEFIDKADLLRFFTPHFANVVVFETFSPDRHNLYFYASDGSLPFSQTWTHAVWTTRAR
jgi:SAM-dependent methyltransferase